MDGSGARQFEGQTKPAVVQTTSDLAHAAYVHMRALRETSLGVELIKISRPNGRDFLFAFRASDEVWETMSLDFVKSESFFFDQTMAALRKHLFSSNDGSRRNGNGRSS